MRAVPIEARRAAPAQVGSGDAVSPDRWHCALVFLAAGARTGRRVPDLRAHRAAHRPIRRPSPRDCSPRATTSSPTARPAARCNSSSRPRSWRRCTGGRLAPEVLAAAAPTRRSRRSPRPQRGAPPLGYPTWRRSTRRLAAWPRRTPTLCALVDLTLPCTACRPTVEGRHLLGAAHLGPRRARRGRARGAGRVRRTTPRDRHAGHRPRRRSQRLLARLRQRSRDHAPPSTPTRSGSRRCGTPTATPTCSASTTSGARTAAPFGGARGRRPQPQLSLRLDRACAGSTSARRETTRARRRRARPRRRRCCALEADRRFAKVLDYHSYGREVLWGYACLEHPLGRLPAATRRWRCSQRVGLRRRGARPRAEGEEEEWQLAHAGRARLPDRGRHELPAVVRVVAGGGGAGVAGLAVDAGAADPGRGPRDRRAARACRWRRASKRRGGARFGNGESQRQRRALRPLRGVRAGGGLTLDVQLAATCRRWSVVVPPGGGVTLDVALTPLARPAASATSAAASRASRACRCSRRRAR